MIAALLSAALAALAALQAPTEADCIADAATLVAEARELLSRTGPDHPPDAGAIAGARRLLRAARREDPSPGLALEAADLAFAAGDEEEGGDLLAAAAEAGPGPLSVPELLRLGRRAEERRRWKEAVERYGDLARALASGGETAAWIAPRVRELEVEAEAEAIAAPVSGPPVEARLALAEGKRALSAGRLRDARASVQAALRIAPDYVEALLALAAVETRAGRPSAAIRAGRRALAAEPERAETMVLLANLLWGEPDRAAKQESLVLLDRAAGLRPELRALLRLSAERWAEYGDAARARERLDRFLARATPAEREAVAPLAETLAPHPEERAPAPEPPAEEPASAAVDRWRKAQVHAARGDAASLAAALGLLSEAETLDPTFARAPELEAAIHERRSEWKEAEAALGRAIRADPSRATSYESLARLLERDPARAPEAVRVWARAEQAGSTEALFPLAQAAERAGRTSEALRLYARYRAEAPAGLRASEASAAQGRLERRRAAWMGGAASASLLVLAGAAVAAWRRRTGRSLEAWLSRHPERSAEVRRIVGRLRHDALKHGGMLLSDGADRIESGDRTARRDAAALLAARLYGDGESGGLVAEVHGSVAALRTLARSDGVRLDLARRDPVFAELLAGERALRRPQADLRRLASGAPAAVGRATRDLRRAARHWQLASGSEMERAIDRAASLPVRLDALEALLSRVAEESDTAAPPLDLLEGPAREGLPPVRLSASDWETLWRNLFGNALEAGRLGLSAVPRRDAATGEPRLRLVLFDDLPAPLTAEEIEARPPDRGLGIVAEILRRNDGSVHVVAPEAAGFTKGIGIELPAVEGVA